MVKVSLLVRFLVVPAHGVGTPGILKQSAILVGTAERHASNSGSRRRHKPPLALREVFLSRSMPATRSRDFGGYVRRPKAERRSWAL
jgi:hypothetical protein